MPVGQPRFQEFEEHLLLVAVVARVAGRDLAAPVDREPHRPELSAHGVDVVVGPLCRMDLLLHGGVFRGQAESVPSHGMEHVEAAGALVAGNDVAHGVVADMAHVDAARGVREHLEDVVFGLLHILFDGEGVAPVPCRLPAGLGVLEGIS